MEKQSTSVSWVRGKRVGKGSFGTVNLAFNKLNGAVFAVKSADRSAGGSLQVEALENEIRILRSLRSSPYVVEFLGDDVSYESSRPYRNLHMEYLPGGTVADMASRGGGGDVDEQIVRSYTWCVVSALSDVHGQGIVHCDVKGKNVLVGSDTGSAKLADFGSAVEFSGEGGAAIMPRGSPLWMAPEVIRGEYQGPESDVWSLGCTVIEMLAGKPAWEDNGIETLSRIGFSDQQPALPAQLSELGRDFIEKCLRRDRSQRWSCDQLLQHPFISAASPNTIAESSPRCVLDCFSSEFNEPEEEYDDVPEIASSSIFMSNEASAKGRISQLAKNSGANWESEGWVVVRSYGRETEEAGTSSAAHSDSLSMRAGIVGGAEREFRYSCGSDLLRRYANGPTCGLFGCGEACSAGGSASSCRCGAQKVDMAVKRQPHLVGSDYGFPKNLLLLFVLQILTIFRHICSSLATYIIFAFFYFSLLSLPVTNYDLFSLHVLNSPHFSIVELQL